MICTQARCLAALFLAGLLATGSARISKTPGPAHGGDAHPGPPPPPAAPRSGGREIPQTDEVTNSTLANVLQRVVNHRGMLILTTFVLPDDPKGVRDELCLGLHYTLALHELLLIWPRCFYCLQKKRVTWICSGIFVTGCRSRICSNIPCCSRWTSSAFSVVNAQFAASVPVHSTAVLTRHAGLMSMRGQLACLPPGTGAFCGNTEVQRAITVRCAHRQ